MVVGREGNQISIRVSNSLKDRVTAWAEKNNRSVNAEITHALETQYPQPPEPESLNKELALAARSVVEAWEGALKALGQDPKSNAQLMRLNKALTAALKDY